MIDDASQYLFRYSSKQKQNTYHKQKSFDDFTVAVWTVARATGNSAYLSTSRDAISTNRVQVFRVEV